MNSKYTRIAVLALIACLPTVFLFAQKSSVQKLDGTSIQVAEIDRIITTLMKNAAVTGLNLGIINNDSVAFIKSYGWKNEAEKEPIDTATVFSAASFSKAVFASLVMQMVLDGKIDLDKPVYQYFDKPLPDYPEYADLAGDERWKLITPRHCLSHTTGFPNWRFLNPNGNGKLEIFFTPGTRYAYSGEGLVLLQMAVEKLSGRGLESVMREKVFQPIGMKNTSYVWQPAFDKNFALGYDGDGNPLQPKKRYEPNAAGSMVTTISDYTKFISAILQQKWLARKFTAEMFTPQVRIHSARQFPSLRTDTTSENDKIQLSYGLGWGLLMSSYGRAFFKEGHDDGWEHYGISFPEKGTAIIIMTNSSNGESIFKELLEKIIGDTFTPWKWENYTPYRSTVVLDSDVLGQYTGKFKQEGMEVDIVLEKGVLKLRSKEGGLENASLYAEGQDRFFLRSFDVNIKFVRDADGTVDRIIADAGNGIIEFKKVSSD